jgi:hypothetical protein
MDEAKFRSKMLQRQRQVGPMKGYERIIIHDNPNEQSLDVIVLINLYNREAPLFLHVSATGSLDGDNILMFLGRAAAAGYIRRNSILVQDNARVHLAHAQLIYLHQLLGAVGATRANTPTYSPEWNPCELVFAEAECFMQNHSRPGWSLGQRTIEAFESISYNNLVAYYRHCCSTAMRMVHGQ